ncbi:response regulator transcription factor [Cellvibrio japonicus]|uniref:Response regulator receiver domain protein n=1 Tax=Cellvibrio japonicus (strain Ueda107) TaxID=498211 RepID=B3PBX1_CELJU|nr:response regulator [Cellvibrio japonicus]ACE85038.1 Response regulator receiver domain protein [Cellvibrio japonicus Ueda107]QEI11786.1 response regulator transcription factor [Cellvibrio japonicus]QEI15360.1 response regulator transcription factor [Cellvibrio japonicus]QEI18939.1 response regulator transcription factor [Cellvibrio japonicus]
MTYNPLLPQVYLIDDDAITLALMEGLVDPLGVQAQCFARAEDFLVNYRPGLCECVVTDMRMPGVSGLQLHKRLLQLHDIAPPLIIVTGYAEVSAAVEAMKQGAFDFVEKPIQGHQFLEKIQAALTLSRELHQQRQALATRQARLALLTPKEQEILQGILQGLSSKEIAAGLGLSVRTVENHRARLMDKLHVKSAIELMRDFMQPAGSLT